MQMFDRVRGQDINILKMFGVKYIVDLMVEHEIDLKQDFVQVN